MKICFLGAIFGAIMGITLMCIVSANREDRDV